MAKIPVSRDPMAYRLGSTSYRVGIAWMWIEGFPTEACAMKYRDYVIRTEKRNRAFVDKATDGTFTVAIHF